MSWMLTYTGKKFDPINPDPESICHDDIAHALANICRFSGHCREFYSVAQHSYMVSKNVPPEDALAGLLHDAAEAYIADIITPVKPHLTNYKELELRIWGAISTRFGVSYEIPESVHVADTILLATEKRDLMPYHPDPWPCLEGVETLTEEITPLDPRHARVLFSNELHRLLTLRGTC